MLKKKLKQKSIFTHRGAVIDKGAIYVVVILTILIFGGFIFVGGTLPTKLPKASSELVAINLPPPEPTKSGLQLYTFYGATGTPRPTQMPRPSSPVGDLKLIECGQPITGTQEPQMVWGYELNKSETSGNELALKVFYTNKHALILGAGNVSRMKKNPADHIASPAIGNTAVKDSNNFPLFPAIFITDITTLTGDVSGDSQAGGQANKPDDIYGTWKAEGTNDPAENGRDLGAGADPWPPANGPPGIHEDNFTSEIIWKTGNLKALDPATKQYASLITGHKYRGQIVLHDGGKPSDIATACVQFTWPGGDQAPIQAPIASSCTAIPTPTKTAPIVSVITFGATGNGSTDDTAAIQNAMDSMSSGGTLEFPPGTYRYSDQLRLTKPNVKLWGYGATLTATNPDDNGIALEADNTHMYGFTRNAPSSWPRGCGSHSFLHRCYGIYITNSRNHEIIDNTINYGLDGPLVHNSSDVLIARNTIYRTTADAIHITEGSTNVRVLQNTVRENGDDMIAVAGYEGRGNEPRNANILIEGNDVSGNYWGRGIAVFGGKDVTIRNNKVSKTALAAGIYISAEGGWNSPNNRNILVEDNDISDVQTTAAAYNPIGSSAKTGHAGIHVYAEGQGVMSDLMFRNNTLDNTWQDGVRIAGNVSNANIIGTTMTGIGTTALAVDVSGTYCSGNTDDGVAVTDPQCTATSPSTVTGASFAATDCRVSIL